MIDFVNDGIHIATSALLAIAAYRAGRASKPRPPKPLEPVCGCTHHLAVHEPDGPCCGMRRVPSRYDQYGDVIAYKEVPCNCRRYIGPEPISSVWVPPPAIERDDRT